MRVKCVFPLILCDEAKLGHSASHNSVNVMWTWNVAVLQTELKDLVMTDHA